MKKFLFIQLLLLTLSNTSFAQVSFSFPAPHTASGMVVKVVGSIYAETIIDNGDSKTFKEVCLVQNGKCSFGYLKSDAKNLCSKLTGGHKLRGSVLIDERKLDASKDMLYMPSPNKVIVEITCSKF